MCGLHKGWVNPYKLQGNLSYFITFSPWAKNERHIVC
nr:MAG TPA: hypothetical protein [Caudoviricetes sp.]